MPARRADDLAREALRLATDDVEGWVPPDDEDVGDPLGAVRYDATGTALRQSPGPGVR